jgi:hypothetical protein
MLPMAGPLPELSIVHVWRADLLVAALPVFGPQESLKGVIDYHAVWKEEAGARRPFMEEEQFLFLSNLSVISLGCFFKIFHMFVHQFLVWE